MQMNPIILEKIKSNNNMITTAQVIELGFSRAILSKYVKAGLLERSRQGIYILSDSVHDDMCTLMMRSDKIVFSHDTALFLNELSERTPFMHSVTIPSNTSLPNSLTDECQCYYIKPELHLIGVIEKKNTMGNVKITLWGYNIETVIAEKVETILSRGVFTTRPRDFYDVYILGTTQKYDKEVFMEIR